MTNDKIAGRYAKSLLDLAAQYDQINEVYRDMVVLSEVCKHREFANMLRSPIISADKKNQIFQSLFGHTLSNLTYRFVALLTDKGRESGLISICRSYIKQYKALMKIRSATVVAASPLSDQQLRELKQNFRHWLQEGEQMELEQRVDPSLVGGFILTMDDKQFDCSVKRQLENLRESLYDTSYINLVEKN